MDSETYHSPRAYSCASSRRYVRSGALPQGPALPANAVEARERLRLHHQRQDHLSRMADAAPGHLGESPADRRDSVRGPGRGTGEAPEPDEQIVGEHAQPEEDRVRPDVPAGHPLQPEAGLEFFVEVLRLPPLVVPAEDRVRGLPRALGQLLATA